MSTTELDVITGEIVHHGRGGSLEFAYSPDQAGQWMRTLQEYRRAVLSPGADYDTIPGTDKPSLLKPGAEKLLLAAGLGFTIIKVDDDDAREHRGVTYRCTIRRDDLIVAECDGYAGYDESRFYTSQADAEAKERANAEKYRRAVNQSKCVEYKAPWNSVIKMAQKRALVGATLNALAASGLFTQDLEDETHAGGAAAFVAHALMEPYLKQLDGESKKELTAWRKNEGLPSSTEMSPEQGAQALVKIGELLARQGDQAGTVRDQAPQGDESVGAASDTVPEPVRVITTKQAQRLHVIAQGLDETVLRVLIFAMTAGTSDSAKDVPVQHYENLCTRVESAKQGQFPNGYSDAADQYATWLESQKQAS